MWRRPGQNFQIARIFGIRIGVGLSWFFVLFFYIVWLSPYFHDVLGGSETKAYGLAVASALAFFASIVLHELGHALAARREGIPVERIDLWFLGGIAQMRGEPQSPGAELRIAGAGPLVTLAIIGLGIGAGELLQSGHFLDVATAQQGNYTVSPGLALVGWLTSINVLVFVFNLVPAFPLDGARIARAAVWWRTGDRNRGTRVTGHIGRGFAFLVGAGGLLLLEGGNSNGIIPLFMALFIYQNASAALMTSNLSDRLSAVRVGDIMDRDPVTVPADTPLLTAQDEFFLRYRWPWFAVVDGAKHFVGLVRSDRVDAEIEAGRPALSVGDVVDPGDLGAQVDENASLETLLTSEALGRLGAVFVVDGSGALRGVVTADQVRRALGAATRR
ncbi:MAG TPA: site-2 protease family protein [Solirubrobacteraceae bacterium]|jgi:Zn-dependent protease|nr:site-2 protease family protein [Solirubrobacteraceae bacterium]